MADTPAQELKQKIVDFAAELVATSELDITVEITRDTSDSITVAFQGPDSHQLAGRGGRVLDALQLIASHAFVRRGAPRMHILFDADNYRARREKMLTDMARELAMQVESTGQEAVLDPLPAMERRIVHQALQEFPGIQTYSEGEDPDRYIVIAPRA
jgi:spoIIIJ-associated protein